MGEIAGHARVSASAADTLLIHEAVHLAITGANATRFKGRDCLFCPTPKLTSAMQCKVGRLEGVRRQ
jgi:hypothetical protein